MYWHDVVIGMFKINYLIQFFTVYWSLLLIYFLLTRFTGGFHLVLIFKEPDF